MSGDDRERDWADSLFVAERLFALDEATKRDAKATEDAFHRIMTEADTVDIADLPSLMRFSALHSTGFDRPLAEVEAEYIKNVVASVGGNRTRAAQILGIDRKTLREKLQYYDSALTKS